LRLILAALAGWALVQGAGPAFAARNAAACDIVTFAAHAAPIEIAAERWQSYRDKVEVILSKALEDDTTQASQDVADALIEAQTALLEPVKASGKRQLRAPHQPRSRWGRGGAVRACSIDARAGYRGGAPDCQCRARIGVDHCTLGTLSIDARPGPPVSAILLLRRRRDPRAPLP
jgi:hypothetical protein